MIKSFFVSCIRFSSRTDPDRETRVIVSSNLLSIDMRMHDMRVNAQSSTGAATGWEVDFDGPSHFLTCRLPVGGTLMKRRHLELLGYTVVSLPFWEFNQLAESDKRKEYLRGKLQIS